MAPLYAEIEAWLRTMVAAGREGDVLPPESEIAENFAVSRMTVRQAMQNLALEGLIVRRRGAGTFIAPAAMTRPTRPLQSFSEEMSRQGRVPSSKLVTAELRSATEGESAALRLKPGSRVVLVHRLRLADSTVMAIERARLIPECAAVLADDLETGSMHAALRRLGWVPTVAASRISARLTTANEAKALAIPPHSPALVELRVISTPDGKPIEYTETVYHAERYVIDAVFTLGPSAETSLDTE